MKFFDYIFLAFQNLWRRKLRSFLTIAAVVIGAVAVLTLVTLVVTASSVFRKQLESIGALTTVTVTSNTEATFEDYGGHGGSSGDESERKLDNAAVREIETLSHVVAVSPATYVWAVRAVRLTGSEKKFEAQVEASTVNVASEKLLVAGRNLRPDEKNAVLLGEWYVQKFGYEEKVEELLGKKVLLTTQPGYRWPGFPPELPPLGLDSQEQKEWWDAQNAVIHETEAEIVGVVQSTIGSNDRALFVGMDWGYELLTQQRYEDDPEAREAWEKSHQRGPTDAESQQFMKIVEENEIDKRGYQYMAVKVNDTDNVSGVAEQIKKMNFGAITAQDFIDEIMKIFQVAGVILGAIGGISLGVASLGIINTMVMSMYERTREIGVMRACGARKSTIRKLFTFEAAMIGFFGGIIGVGILFVLAKVGNIFGNKFLVEQNIPLENIIDPPLWLILGVVAFTTIIGLLAGLYPAFKAARLRPVDALRYE